MSDELEGQETPDPTSETFDWSAFFSDDDAGDPPAAAAMGGDDDDDDDLRAQLKRAEETSAKALALAQQATSQSQMRSAIEAWEAQASPEELLAKPVLLASQSPEELKAAARFAKAMAPVVGQKLNQTQEQNRLEMEALAQREYGVPITAQVQPKKNSEKVTEALASGDTMTAINTLMEGFPT